MAEPTNTSSPGGALPADARREPHAPRSYFRDAGGHVWRDLKLKDLVAARAECADHPREGATLWVHIDSTDRAQHAVLEKVFNFHPLAIEDTLSPDSRIRVEEYDGYLFAIVRAVAFQPETEDPYDLETVNVYFFIGSTYLVTVRAGPSPSIDAVAQLVERNPALLGEGAARVAHLVMDAAIDAYFPVLEGIDGFLDNIEPRVFEDFDETALQDIFHVKRLVLSLRRYLAPQREVFNILGNRPTPLFTGEAQRYFRDVYDHVLRIYDSLDSARELLGSTLDSYLTQVSNRTGQATKGLSVVATLSVPFVVIAGIYGMNFERIPLAQHPHGFWLMVGLQLGVGVALVLLLRWRKLI